MTADQKISIGLQRQGAESLKKVLAMMGRPDASHVVITLRPDISSSAIEAEVFFEDYRDTYSQKYLVTEHGSVRID